MATAISPTFNDLDAAQTCRQSGLTQAAEGAEYCVIKKAVGANSLAVSAMTGIYCNSSLHSRPTGLLIRLYP